VCDCIFMYVITWLAVVIGNNLRDACSAVGRHVSLCVKPGKALAGMPTCVYAG
jgi:hypothetical protein